MVGVLKQSKLSDVIKKRALKTKVMRTHWGLTIFFLSMTAYFSYYSVYGRRGCFVWREKRKILVVQREEVKRLAQKKNNLEQKVMLFEQTVDADLLEQMGWQVLRMMPKNHCVVTYGK